MIRIRRIRANNFKQLREIDLFLPPQGRFLVQGKNEAGKSTLFEAVFFGIFGTPLVTETGRRRLDDLIRYGIEEAYVELWLDAPGRLLKIRRTIVREKANDWQLDIVTPGDIEEVRGNRPVNNRVVDELQFDAEALLNTAFVEQKKLDKLEGMGRAQREQSLMKLLNLEHMTDLESDFKLRGEDRMALQRAQQRAELAKVQAELPNRVRKLDEVEHQLLFIELKRSLEATLRERAAMARLTSEVEKLTKQRAALAEQAEQVAQLREGLQTAREIYGLRERATDLAKEIERLRRELSETKELRDQTLPELVTEREALQLLRDRLRRASEAQNIYQESQNQTDQLESRLDELTKTSEQLAETRARERELRTAISEQETRLQDAEYLASAYRVHEALSEWVSAQASMEAPARREEALNEARGHHAALSRRIRWEAVGLGCGIAAAVLLTRLVAGLVVGLLVGVATVLLAVLVWRVLNAAGELGAVSEHIGRLEGERDTLQASADRDQAKLEAAEQRLDDLNAIKPSTVERGRQAIAELVERLGDRSPDALQSEADDARERLARAKALHEEATRDIERLEKILRGADVPALEQHVQDVRRQAAEAEAIFQTHQNRAAQLAEALDLEPDPSIVEGRLGALENEVRNVERRIAGAETVEEELAVRQTDLEELWDRIESLYAQLVELDLGLPEWDRDEAADLTLAAGKTLRQAYEDAGGEGVQQELQEIQTAIGRKEGERNTRREQAESQLEQVRLHIQRLGLDDDLPEDPADEDLNRWMERIEHLGVDDEPALKDERDDLRERVGYLREQRQALESALGLEDQVLDVDATQAELEAKERELQVRQKAQEIVELARRRLVEQVLPNTMEHMRRVLPVLTMQRYYDAELTEDYRIRVWDERAGQGGDWKEKNIFSGGTKDQFSLALRLAFALATLPEERGSAPSFIFLDEPLSSFDNERARALLHLLTEGEIAQSFDQIFLISHVRVNPASFNYHITVDQGRVVESDLPEPDESAVLASIESRLVPAAS